MTKHLAEHVRLILSRISLCAVLAAACLDQAESSERARLKPDTQQTRSATGKLDRNPGTATLENSTIQAVLEKNPLGLCFGHGAMTTISLTDWEGEAGLGSWVAGRHPLNTPTPDWEVWPNLPNGRSGKAAFVANLDFDTCTVEDTFGALTLESPDITIPPGTAVPRIAIDHWIATEAGYDGGNFKISVDDGPFVLVPSSAIEVSPYNGTLYPIDRPNTNPLAGEEAFTGSDDGTTGSWGQSIVNLFGIAEAGNTVRLRFDFGVDDCDGLVGWYVDDVRVYSCSAELPPSDCGNGVLDDGEECDDGNTYIQDGCSNTCQVEDGWQCTLPTPPAISDPGFEATETLPPPDNTLKNAFWTQYSLNFDNAVICSELYCGTLTGSGAANGDYWAWLGGYLGGYEEARLSQETTIPATASELTFALEVSGTCVSSSDYVELLVDGVREFYVNASSPLCGNLGYTVQTVDLCDYADDGVHTIEFHAETFGPTDLSLFFIDDVQIPGTPSVCTELSSIFFDGFESKSGPCPEKVIQGQ